MLSGEASAPTVAKPTRQRYLMLALILTATVISYIDRINISIVAPFIAKDLGISKVDMGLIFSAFAWTYAFGLVPGGIFVDRFGSRLAYTLSVTAWSLATVLQAVATGFLSLFGLRLAVGFAETPAFPANARAVTMWFPQKERGLATSVYVMGQYIGTALFSGMLLWIASEFGWQYVFIGTGAVGLLFGVVWYRIYRDPMQNPRANEAELRHIESGGDSMAAAAEKARFSWRHMVQLLKCRQIIAICLGKFCNSSSLYFFLTWFPTYLVEERKMTMIKVGIFASMPFIGATLGILLAGFFSDWFIRRGCSMSTARKAPLIIGCLLGTTIVLANFTDSDAVCIAILTCAFFAQGVAATSWAAMSECAPVGYVGLTGGITSLSANIAGIITPVIIGYIVQSTGNFYWALNFVGLIALCGALSYSLLLGTLHRIVLDKP
jgi:D-galactonate transporter